MKGNRNGEMRGWTVGWLGGFVWVVLLSAFFLIQGRTYPGVIGLVLFGVAVATIVSRAPWRNADTLYWKLMLPVYAVLACSLAWAVWSMGGFSEMGLNWWNALWILPALIPLKTAGQKRWSRLSG